MLNPKPDWIDVANLPGVDGREDRQYGWQCYFGRLFRTSTILDVGAGLGKSRERLADLSNRVTLQDIGPGLPVDISSDVSEIESRSFDIVTAFDVIEHVRGDIEFLSNLRRIAKQYVVITTPNFHVSRCANPYHCREYSPSELVMMAGGPSSVCLLATGRDMIHTLRAYREFLFHMEPSQAVVIDCH